MKKFIISTNRKKKIDWIKANVHGDIFLIARKSDNVMNEIPNVVYLSDEDIKHSIIFLDKLSKVANKTIVIFDCLRYDKHNASLYNKVYEVIRQASSVVVTSDLPFKFDFRNTFVPLKMLGEMKYHYKQWYDDSFYEDDIQVNSIKCFFDKFNDLILYDKKDPDYIVYDWESSEKEILDYESHKKKVIFEKEYSKAKVVTSCQGRCNRMKSKLEKLKSILEINKKYLIVMNWEKGMPEMESELKDFNVDFISYHDRSDEKEKSLFKYDYVIFYETIISQKIKFYDLLMEYMEYPIIFFINQSIGVDKKNTESTIKLVDEIKEFNKYAWKVL